MVHFPERGSTTRQAATNTGHIAPGNTKSTLPPDGFKERQDNKPSATITTKVWMANGPGLIGAHHHKLATSP